MDGNGKTAYGTLAGGWNVPARDPDVPHQYTIDEVLAKEKAHYLTPVRNENGQKDRRRVPLSDLGLQALNMQSPEPTVDDPLGLRGTWVGGWPEQSGCNVPNPQPQKPLDETQPGMYGHYGPPVQQVYEGSATRTVKKERYDLIPPEADDAIARRIGMGVARHGENNWRGGGMEFIKATINHMRAHTSALLKGNRSDNDLDAIICNAAFLCWFRDNRPEHYEAALQSLRSAT